MLPPTTRVVPHKTGIVGMKTHEAKRLIETPKKTHLPPIDAAAVGIVEVLAFRVEKTICIALIKPTTDAASPFLCKLHTQPARLLVSRFKQEPDDYGYVFLKCIGETKFELVIWSLVFDKKVERTELERPIPLTSCCKTENLGDI